MDVRLRSRGDLFSRDFQSFEGQIGDAMLVVVAVEHRATARWGEDLDVADGHVADQSAVGFELGQVLIVGDEPLVGVVGPLWIVKAPPPTM